MGFRQASKTSAHSALKHAKCAWTLLLETDSFSDSNAFSCWYDQPMLLLQESSLLFQEASIFLGIRLKILVLRRLRPATRQNETLIKHC